jgi:hypothetical protein
MRYEGLYLIQASGAGHDCIYTKGYVYEHESLYDDTLSQMTQL